MQLFSKGLNVCCLTCFRTDWFSHLDSLYTWYFSASFSSLTIFIFSAQRMLDGTWATQHSLFLDYTVSFMGLMFSIPNSTLYIQVQKWAYIFLIQPDKGDLQLFAVQLKLSYSAINKVTSMCEYLVLTRLCSFSGHFDLGWFFIIPVESDVWV